LTASGTITAPRVKSFQLQTSAGTSDNDAKTDWLEIRNNADQTIVAFTGASKTTYFEGHTIVYDRFDAESFGDVEVGSSAAGDARNLTVWGNSQLKGNVTIGGYLTARPYISMRVSTTGGTPSTINAGNVVVGTPGTVTVTQLGSNTSVVCTRGTAGNSNYLLYTFSWTGTHPLGSNYVAHATFQTGGTSSFPPNTPVITTNASSTSITVWIRGTLTSGGVTYPNVLQDGNFYLTSYP